MTNLTNTRQSISEATALIAKRMSRQINAEQDFGKMSIERFNQLIDLRVNKFSFENETARSFFTRAIIKQIDRKSYYSVFPKIGMDEKGEYTYDSTKWA